jgi:cytoskeleton protein RodZ
VTEEQDRQSVDQPPDEPGGPLAGERLAAARREQSIGVHEVAKELHLDEAKVRALESNDFALLGAPVFAKGHLRKYAQLVGIDVAEVLEDYYKLTRSDAPPPIVSGRPRVRQELSPAPWIALIVAASLAAGVYWWLSSREGPVPVPAEPVPAEAEPARNEIEAGIESEAAAERQPEPLPAAGDEAAEYEEPEVADQPAEPETRSPEAERPSPVRATTDPAAGRNVALTVEFSGDCWTEISDADGRRLFFAMGRDGQTVELSGKAPLNALFGNGDHVSLLLDGREYPLPATNANSRMLRLSINAVTPQ